MPDCSVALNAAGTPQYPECVPRDFPAACQPALARAGRPNTAFERACAFLGVALVMTLVLSLGWAPRAQATSVTAQPMPQASLRLATETTPLTVTISSLTPAVLRPKGPLRITGTISNDSATSWRDINLHPITSHRPLTTPEQVDAAGLLAQDAVFGDRITELGSFAHVDELAPGQQESFTIRVPREALGIGTAPGVYLVGVHALATSDEGRQTAGRDRMFLPLVENPGQGQVAASMVVPIRARVNRDAEGHLTDLERWRQLLGRGGRLHDLLELVTTTDVSVTWLVDPAVLDAVEQIAGGNTGDQLMLVEENGPDDGESPSPTDVADATGTASAVPVPSASGSAHGLADDDLRASAEQWLSRATAALREHQVLALPYGDVDVSAASEAGPRMAPRAAARSTRWLDRHGIISTPAVSPPNGRIRPQALPGLSADTVTLIDRSQIDSAQDPDATGAGEVESSLDGDAPDAASTATDSTGTDSTQPVSLATDSHLRVGDRVVVVSDSLAPESSTLNATALRQRLLAEAAVRRQSGIIAPLVVQLPDGWHPQSASGLLENIDRTWLRSTDVPTTTAGAEEFSADELSYPASAVEAQVPASRFADAARTLTAADKLVRVIDGPSPYSSETERALLTTLSPMQTDAVGVGVELATRQQTVLNLLGSIRIQAPPRVTLSSTTGQFPGTLENDLDVPVKVQVHATTDGQLTLTDPGTLNVPAKGRRTIRFEATSSKLGTHQVSLQVTDTEGTPLGNFIEIPVRAGSVSVIVWWIVAGGGVLLVLMILKQWRRRGLRRRAAPLPDPEAARPIQPSTDTPLADAPTGGEERG